MFALLIVDDEPLIRNGVSRIIDWESLGFTEIYQAEDGLEALELVRKHKIDLVLTDIVMPFMDGLELSKALNQEYPEIQVVILTGHEDFEYAKQSVDLGVRNYILKPVGAATLYEKMKVICEKLNIQATQKEYIAKMKIQIHRSLPVLQEKFLYTLVCTDNVIQDPWERITSLELPLSGTDFLTAILEPDYSGINQADTELFQFTTKNIAFDIIGNAHSLFDDNHRIIIVFHVSSFAEEPHEIIYTTLRVIQKTVYSVLKIEVACAMGSVVQDIRELHLSYQEADKAIECKHSLGQDGIYDIKDLNYVEKSFYYPLQEIKELIGSVKFMQEAAISLAMKEIHESLFVKQSLPPANLKMIYIEIVTSLLRELSGMKEVPASLWERGFGLYRFIERMSSFGELEKELVNFSKEVSRGLRCLQSSSGHRVIQQVKAFVDSHYAEEALSLTTVAGEIAVSSGYLSALFKKETGTNFVKYLTDVRMEKAKSLLSLTDKKTYEIAYETGFANPHYFSISFKKYTGMSPSDFRSIQEKQV